MLPIELQIQRAKELAQKKLDEKPVEALGVHELLVKFWQTLPNNTHCAELAQKSALMKRNSGSDLDRIKMIVFKLYGIQEFADIRYVECSCKKNAGKDEENDCLLLFFQAFIAFNGALTFQQKACETDDVELQRWGLRGLWQATTLKHMVGKCKAKIPAFADISHLRRYPFSWHVDQLTKTRLLSEEVIDVLFEILLGEIRVGVQQSMGETRKVGDPIRRVQVLSKTISEPGAIPLVFHALLRGTPRAVAYGLENFSLLVNEPFNSNSFSERDWQEWLFPFVLEIDRLISTVEYPATAHADDVNLDLLPINQLTGHYLGHRIFRLAMAIFANVHFYQMCRDKEDARSQQKGYDTMIQTIEMLKKRAGWNYNTVGIVRFMFTALLNKIMFRRQQFTKNFMFDEMNPNLDKFFDLMEDIEGFSFYMPVRGSGTTGGSSGASGTTPSSPDDKSTSYATEAVGLHFDRLAVNGMGSCEDLPLVEKVLEAISSLQLDQNIMKSIQEATPRATRQWGGRGIEESVKARGKEEAEFWSEVRTWLYLLTMCNERDRANAEDELPNHKERDNILVKLSDCLNKRNGARKQSRKRRRELQKKKLDLQRLYTETNLDSVRNSQRKRGSDDSTMPIAAGSRAQVVANIQKQGSQLFVSTMDVSDQLKKGERRFDSLQDFIAQREKTKHSQKRGSATSPQLGPQLSRASTSTLALNSHTGHVSEQLASSSFRDIHSRSSASTNSNSANSNSNMPGASPMLSAQHSYSDNQAKTALSLAAVSTPSMTPQKTPPAATSPLRPPALQLDLGTEKATEYVEPISPTSPMNKLTCKYCRKELDVSKFYELHGATLCEEHYRVLCTTCLLCNRSIGMSETYVSFQGNVFHEKCFHCERCGTPFQSTSDHVYQHHGKYYCELDYYETYGTKCHACKQLIMSKEYVALGSLTYHHEHFTCSLCDKVLDPTHVAKPFEANQPANAYCFHKPTQELYCAEDYQQLVSQNLMELDTQPVQAQSQQSQLLSEVLTGPSAATSSSTNGSTSARGAGPKIPAIQIHPIPGADPSEQPVTIPVRRTPPTSATNATAAAAAKDVPAFRVHHPPSDEKDSGKSSGAKLALSACLPGSFSCLLCALQHPPAESSLRSAVIVYCGCHDGGTPVYSSSSSRPASASTHLLAPSAAASRHFTLISPKASPVAEVVEIEPPATPREHTEQISAAAQALAEAEANLLRIKLALTTLETDGKDSTIVSSSSSSSSAAAQSTSATSSSSSSSTELKEAYDRAENDRRAALTAALGLTTMERNNTETKEQAKDIAAAAAAVAKDTANSTASGPARSLEQIMAERSRMFAMDLGGGAADDADHKDDPAFANVTEDDILKGLAALAGSPSAGSHADLPPPPTRDDVTRTAQIHSHPPAHKAPSPSATLPSISAVLSPSSADTTKVGGIAVIQAVAPKLSLSQVLAARRAAQQPPK